MADGVEVLVVSSGYGRAGSGRWPVLSRVPPDVIVVRADPADLPDLTPGARLVVAHLPGGARILGGEACDLTPPEVDAVLAGLDEGAGLFVRAFLARAEPKPGRPGDGLPWDAPGFSPPDP